MVICYKAIVKVDVYDEAHKSVISRQDVGFGTGVARNLADAHENSAKEAVTDALKRSLRSFGNQFGNSLYDKSKNSSSTPQAQNVPNNVPNTQNVPNNNVPSTAHNQAQMPNQSEIQSLNNIGLSAVEQDGFLLVRGQDIFSKKDIIKSLGFRWDGKSKQWYKQVANAA